MIVDLLEQAAIGGHGQVRFVTSSATTDRTLRALWEASADAARWFSRHAGPAGVVATVLSSSEASLVALIGALRAGVTLLSLPFPARGDSVDWYAQFVSSVCLAYGARDLIVDARYEALASTLPVRVQAFEHCTAAGQPLPRSGDPRLVQFTSGSTSSPKGVVLTADALAHHVVSILEVIDPRPGEAACSWLPLSHDLGLIGMTLAAWVASSHRWARDGRLVLIDPESYVHDPAIWIRACASEGATITAAPPKSYRAAAAQLSSDASLRLDALRVAIVGAEPIPPEWLRSFDAAARRHGAHHRVLCPAYGLAEATLAVTICPPSSPWRSMRIDRGALAIGRCEAGRGADTVEVVGLGTPVPGTEIRAGRRLLGPVAFRSPHAAAGYTERGRLPATNSAAGTWFETRDLGFVGAGNELYVVGRADDILFANGRNIHPEDVERVLASSLRAVDTAAAVGHGATGVDIVVELTPRASLDQASRTLGRAIRRLVHDTHGLAVERVLATPRGRLPRTPSGKIRRHETRVRLRQGTLETIPL